ncbi:MAG: electron transport complex subunit E [Eubacteriales bacterium]|nr:electron transport complex subunit E [Eubacteriales bacterium]
MKGNKFKGIAVDGLLRNNPTLRLVLGTCPTLALSTTAMNGIGMGLAVTFILICSNTLISLLRKVIPNAVRIPSFVLIIATFVTVVRMVMEKFIPDLYDSLGVYLPLIVVNCVILGRAEAFASKNPMLDSAADGLFTGLGFTWALTLLGVIREVLGSGSIFGVELWSFRIEFFTSAAGAFFTYGVMIALFNALFAKIDNVKKRKEFYAAYPDAIQPEKLETKTEEVK